MKLPGWAQGLQARVARTKSARLRVVVVCIVDDVKGSLRFQSVGKVRV